MELKTKVKSLTALIVFLMPISALADKYHIPISALDGEYKEGKVISSRVIYSSGCFILDDDTVAKVDLTTIRGRTSFALATTAQLSGRKIWVYFNSLTEDGGCWAGGHARSSDVVFME